MRKRSQKWLARILVVFMLIMNYAYWGNLPVVKAAETTLSIQEVRTIPLSSKDPVRVTGVVTYTDGKNYYIQDDTAGIDVFKSGLSPAPALGDELTVTGTLSDYNNLLEIVPIEVTINSSGNALPEAQVRAIDQIDDSVESQLIQIRNVKIGAINSSGSTPLTDAKNQVINIYKIPTLTDVSEGDYVDVTAVVTQYKTSYQLLVSSSKGVAASTPESEDSASPGVSNITPADHAVMSETKPGISAKFTDYSGIDVNLITVSVDDADVTASSTISATGFTYTPTADLAPGKHTVKLHVVDSAGTSNSTDKSWSFYSSVTSIQDARTKASDTLVAVQGIVTYTDKSYNFYIQDATAGIDVYKPTLISTVVPGDQVIVSGKISEFNSLLEIAPVASNVDTLVLSSNNPLPQPKGLSIDQIEENVEGQRILLKDVTLGATVSNNTALTDDANQSTVIYKMPTLDGINVGDKVNVTAVVSQYKTTYRLLVNSAEDIVKASPSSTVYASDLFISEYIEGSSNNKAIEIFNGTSSTVDLSSYTVELYSNGSSTDPSTLPLTGNLKSGEVYIIAHSQAGPVIAGLKDVASGVANFNGNDALVLKHGETTIDSFGQVGVDPGSAWGASPNTTVDHTLVRKASVTLGDSDAAGAFDPTTEWDFYPKDTFTYLGSHTMNGFQSGSGDEDTTPPTIVHTPVTTGSLGADVPISAQVTDNHAVESVKLYYRTVGDLVYTEADMQLTSGVYAASIPAEVLTTAGLEYYIEASDGANTATSPATLANPYLMNIKDTVGPEVTDLTPAEGGSATAKPLISAKFSDPSGIDADSVQIELDETNITDGATLDEDGFSYTPSSDLANGKHTVKVSVRDKATGTPNTSEVSWSFYVGEIHYNPYFGGLHSHTNLSDGTGTPEEAFSWAKNKGQGDYMAITDHSNWFDNDKASESISDVSASTSNSWKTLRQAADDFTANNPGFVAIGGYEMTWSGSTGGWGHINTFNTPWFASRNNSAMDLPAYYQKVGGDPNSINQLNHPGPTFGDFADFGYWTPEADKVVNLVEVGNGEGEVGSSGYFPSYEYYTRALDKGWHVAPSNNQDNHMGGWLTSNEARTVILAPELTRDALYDGIRHKRAYATEDRNLNINYTVNGQIMGSILEDPQSLSFHVEFSDPDSADNIKSVSIISNGGAVVESKEFNSNTGTWDFQLDPDNSYYYVRIDEADKDIAVTAPVWTGDVVPVGLSKVEISQDPQFVNTPTSFTATVYNNGVSALNNVPVEFFKDSIAPENKIGTTQTIAQVAPSSTGTATITWSPDQTGKITIYAQATIQVEGQDKIFQASTNFEVAEPEDVIQVVIDGGHFNQYVTGDYPGKMTALAAMLKNRKTMLVQNNDELTAQDLTHAKVLIITDPAGKDKTGITKSTFSEDELQVIKDFTDQGGSLIITSRADYDDKGVTDPSYQSSAQGNAVLDRIGSNLRFNDDEVIDDTLNGGQNYRLYFDDYTGAKYHLTDNIPVEETYSAYSGCSVLLKDGEEDTTVDWLVKGHETTTNLDSDTASDYVAIPEGEVNSLAAEILPSGAKVVVAGTTFFSDFETATVDNAYSNALLTQNIVSWLTAAPLKTIAEVRADENQDGVPDLLGQRVAVEGTVTAQSKAMGDNTAFFDVIYVQDETGGLTIFGVSTRAIPLGTKVRVTGKVGQYDGDSQIQINNENFDLETLDSDPSLMAPKLMSTANVMKEANEGWLVKVVGTVKDIKTTDGDNSLYIDDGSGVARVYVNGYIGDGTANTEMLGKWDASIAIGDYVSAIGLASQDAVGHRIRVRNTGEIIKLARPVTHDDDGGGTVTAPSNPGPVNGVWIIAPTQQEVVAASASEMVPAAAGGTIRAQDGTSVVLPPNVTQSGTLNIKVGIGQVGQVPGADTITMFEPVLTQREFTANVSQFDAPVTISIPYKGVDLQGIDPSLLAIFWWNPDRQTWIKVGGIVDPVTQTISVPVYHFSTYAVMADQSAMAERLAGEDRFGTAIAVAEQGWPSGSDTVILANAQAYADALAGTPLAFKFNAPILLTDAAGLTASTATELKKLRASKVVLLGGEGVIRSTVEAQLSNLGYSVTRYGGADRFGTAKAIADALGSRRQAVVVSGEDAHAVDALAIASWAAYHGAPILFTEKDTLPSLTQEVLNQGQPSLVYVVGGAAVVSDTVLKAVGGTRLAGADRYETATRTAAALGLNSDYVYVATGLDCVDALVAGNLAAKTNSPVLYVNDSVPTVLSDYVKANRSNIEGITIIGGAGVVKAELANALKESLKH